MVSHMDAIEVHHMLDEIFTMFDDEAEKHSVEKIKTIGTVCIQLRIYYIVGDAYMAAAGLWQQRVDPSSGEVPTDHAAQIVDFAQDVLEGLHIRGICTQFDSYS